MATAIRPLEGPTVHQIQSGQVIVDLCSVVKELVENSLDAGAVSIEVRFKNNGLDSIEVQDNGTGIASENFENVALKHYTSKLASYDELASLETFGFRGEALSSLCALSNLHIITALANQVPKGTRLDYEASGKLKHMSVTATQKGTTVSVEDLFFNLPVRRKELEKNIKREYGKVLSLLQAYACISTNTRILVSNVPVKGKRAVIFATKSNSTTRENIANIFGTKALHVLLAMNLHFDLKPTSSLIAEMTNRKVSILGHVSRPVVGEGRSAPDRQMFFINGRPCHLPQVAKVFNEVYKSFNVSQSPFIFANISLDMNAYDVNVSPDKKNIMLHDQSSLLESLRVSLTELFEEQDQKIPQTQKPVPKMPAFELVPVIQGSLEDVDSPTFERRLIQGALDGNIPHLDDEDHGCRVTEQIADSSIVTAQSNTMMSTGLGAERHVLDLTSNDETSCGTIKLPNAEQKSVPSVKRPSSQTAEANEHDDSDQITWHLGAERQEYANPVENLNEGSLEQKEGTKTTISLMNLDDPGNSKKRFSTTSSNVPSIPLPGVIPNAFERMRPRRQLPQLTTVTIGSKTTSAVLGDSVLKRCRFYSHSPPLSAEADLSRSEIPDEESSQQKGDFETSRGGTKYISTAKESKFHLEREESSSEESCAEGSQIWGRVSDIREVAVQDETWGKGRRKSPQSENTCVDEHTSDEMKKAREETKVPELIRYANEVNSSPTSGKGRPAFRMLKSTEDKDSITGLIRPLQVSIRSVSRETNALQSTISTSTRHTSSSPPLTTLNQAISLDEQLTLTISKHDFRSMHVIGQFNLGFILATRNGTDLLIIDQHASDEKYNFERLQKTTIVRNQRLVQPRGLELTAFDEEIILDNVDALIKNGFQVEVDQSGVKPVGKRCNLLSLPMSREVTFDLSDLEELIALLAETSHTESSDHVPRPSKVRRMFAMRACRSSIMIGRTLTMIQMQELLRHMGDIDRPWNCPHGRPTMRHVCDLSDWVEWKDGNGLGGLEEQLDLVDWASWIESARDISNTEIMEEVSHVHETVDLAGEEKDFPG